MTDDLHDIRLGRRAFLNGGTLVAMVEGRGAENNGYSLLEIAPGDGIRLTGFRRQQSRRWDQAG